MARRQAHPLVNDELSSHSAAAPYKTFAPEEARRILSRIELHFVPKQASWLNMVEIEIGALESQRLDRRLEDRDALCSEDAAWERARNEQRATIERLFTVEKARPKMRRAYRGPGTCRSGS